jgi:hypothetical protein
MFVDHPFFTVAPHQAVTFPNGSSLTGCVTDRVGDGRSNATQNAVKLTTNLLDHGVVDTLGWSARSCRRPSTAN